MKILIYGINYAPELVGVGKYTSEMAEWLAKRGHQVHVVATPPYYPEWQVSGGYSSLLYRHEIIQGVSVWRCPLWVPKQPTGIKRILYLVSYALTSFPVMLVQAFWRPGIIINIEPPFICAPTSILVSRLCGSRSWLHIQDYEVDAAFELGILTSKLSRKIALYFERRLMSMFSGVSTITNKMMLRLSQKGVHQERQVLIPNWVDVNFIKPLDRESQYRRELQITRQEVVALYSGNMGQKQGLEILVHAAKLIEDRKYIKIVLCGEGSALKRLKILASGLQNIIWLPLQPFERLNELLNMADIHLLPQRAEAADLVMPSKLTGMLASGRPVIATANPETEMAMLLKDKGIIVKPDDAQLLAKEIIHLADNETDRTRMGMNGRLYAIENLAKEKIMRQMEKIFLGQND